MQSIPVAELKKRLSDGDLDEVLVDVREDYEYKEMSIPGAKNVPMGTLETVIPKLKSIGTVYVHCQSGGRSSRACQMLEEAGVNVVNIDGGILAWDQAGFDVVRTGKHRLPIMRQVFIVAGTLVFTGAILGTWVNDWWHALSAFVGAGLVFAGVTGICTMSFILARMPWNR